MAAGYRKSEFPASDNPYCSASSSVLPPLPLLFFSFTLFLFLSLSLFLSYQSVLEGLIDQTKLVLVVSPLLLLLVVRWLSTAGGPERRWLSHLFPWPERRDSIHNRDSTSPWGITVLLVVLMFMASYQSYFSERWFPLLSRV